MGEQPQADRRREPDADGELQATCVARRLSSASPAARPRLIGSPQYRVALFAKAMTERYNDEGRSVVLRSGSSSRCA
jgi:hypothetical protein